MKVRVFDANCPTISALGLGCMGLSAANGAASEAESIATIHRALDLGLRLFDSADVEGNGATEDLLGRAVRGMRQRILFATKCGMVPSPARPDIPAIDGSSAHIDAAVDASHGRLGIKSIDLPCRHRIDRKVSVEERVGAMAEQVAAGKTRNLGLSECAAVEFRRGHGVHPITALQSEYSLWTRIPEGDVQET